MKRPRIHYGRRYGVKPTIPPEGILEVAHTRTEGMVGYFLDTSRDPIRWHERLYQLAASAYLQGINDAIEAETRQRARGLSQP